MSTAESLRLAQGIIFSDLAIREAITDKWSLIGLFESFSTQVFPLLVPRFFITLFITNFTPDKKSLHLRINVVGENEEHLGGAEGTVERLSQNTFTPDEVLQVAVPLGPFTFSAPGRNKVTVLIDGAPSGERTLHVIKIDVTPLNR